MTSTNFILLAAITAGTSLSTAAFCQNSTPTSPPPCSGDEFRQLDFWVGDWNAEWDNPDGSIGHGVNHITRDEFGDCVIYERFNGNGLVGMSVSTYFAPLGIWRQTWVDDQGGYFALIGGPAGEDDPFDFVLTNTRLSENAPFLRMIWQDVTEDSFTWRWQGRATREDEWADRWVIRYTRMDEE